MHCTKRLVKAKVTIDEIRIHLECIFQNSGKVAWTDNFRRYHIILLIDDELIIFYREMASCCRLNALYLTPLFMMWAGFGDFQVIVKIT